MIGQDCQASDGPYKTDLGAWLLPVAILNCIRILFLPKCSIEMNTGALRAGLLRIDCCIAHIPAPLPCIQSSFRAKSEVVVPYPIA
jgi:hypothetical protein